MQCPFSAAEHRSGGGEHLGLQVPPCMGHHLAHSVHAGGAPWAGGVRGSAGNPFRAGGDGGTEGAKQVRRLSACNLPVPSLHLWNGLALVSRARAWPRKAMRLALSNSAIEFGWGSPLPTLDVPNALT